MLGRPRLDLAHLARHACLALQRSDHALGISESLLSMIEDVRGAFDHLGESELTGAEAQRIARDTRASCASVCERMAAARDRAAARASRRVGGAATARRLRVEADAMRACAAALWADDDR